MDDFELTAHDKTTSLWLRLSAHLESRLADARIKNDAERTEVETAALRGEIRMLKRLIALGETRPFLTGDEDAP